jgi:hypothetical protein
MAEVKRTEILGVKWNLSRNVLPSATVHISAQALVIISGESNVIDGL